MKKISAFKKRGYLWITLALFLISLAGHWSLAWSAYKNEAREHKQVPQANEFLVEVGRDTLENWQSEFLQLIWQVAGLSFLWFVGAPESKEGEERKEEKLDHIIKTIDSQNAEKVLKDLERKFPKK